MPKKLRIYCEGKKGSHDFDLLEKLTAGLPPCEIEPIGSKRGAGAIIEWHRQHGGVSKPDVVILFRDRDFDQPLPPRPELERDPSKKAYELYYSYRITIENYLLSPDVLWNFLNSKDPSKRFGISSPDAAADALIESAQHIRHYQAVRHAMALMRNPNTDFGTTWTQGSGNLPQKLDADACLQSGWDRIRAARSFADVWTEDVFRQHVESFARMFDDAFMRSLRFIEYFQGKDLAKALTSTILQGFELEPYYKYAKESFDYRQFPDLLALRGILEGYLLS